MIIEEIIKYNENFVASKAYEKYLTSKYPDKKLAVWTPASLSFCQQLWA